jgi:hypothetical protein
VREARALEQFGVHVDLTRAESILENLLRRRIGVGSEEPQGQRTQEG